jgi:hypothetical protein
LASLSAPKSPTILPNSTQLSAAHKTRLKDASRAEKAKLAAKAVGSAITCATEEASDIVKYSIKTVLGARGRLLTDFQSDPHRIIAKELDSHPGSPMDSASAMGHLARVGSTTNRWAKASLRPFGT